jgi:hypothetical protein
MQPSDDEIRAMLAGVEKWPTPWLNSGGENAVVTDCYLSPVAYYVPSSLRPLLSATPDLAALALSRGDALAKAEAENARLRMILAARDAYDRGEPSTPPITGKPKRALGGDDA